jgi:perosamine synthetase
MQVISISKPYIKKDEINAVVKVLKSANLAQGPIVKELEEKIAKYCGVKYAVALNNATAGLHTSLYALGIEEGDEVITTPFTFVATANAILMQRAKPVFVDIEEDTFNIDPDKISKKISKKTKAIMPVDLFGHIYDVKRINEIAKKENIRIVEDAAQSIGAEYNNQMAGSVADIGSFSLYATKNLTAGIGGLIVTNDKDIMEKAKLFRHHGQDESSNYDYIQFGYNYRMLDMTAAIALVQLERINFLTDRRRENANLYNSQLKDINGLILPVEKTGFKHVYHQYTIRITKDFKCSRDQFIEYMNKRQIQCKIYYPKPLHLYPHIVIFGYKKGDFPVAERLAEEVVSIPVHPLVTTKQIEYIIKKIKSI